MNDKWWSILFGIVMIGCGGHVRGGAVCRVVDAEGMSSHAKDIDFLFNLILAITGFFFILTEALLIGFMYRYTPCEPGETRMPSLCWKLVKPLTGMFNTATKIELAWTIVPAVILVYIAFAQVSTWADVKYKSRLNTALGWKGQKWQGPSTRAARHQRPAVRVAHTLSGPGHLGKVEDRSRKGQDLGNEP